MTLGAVGAVGRHFGLLVLVTAAEPFTRLRPPVMAGANPFLSGERLVQTLRQCRVGIRTGSDVMPWITLE